MKNFFLNSSLLSFLAVEIFIVEDCFPALFSSSLYICFHLFVYFKISIQIDEFLHTLSLLGPTLALGCPSTLFWKYLFLNVQLLSATGTYIIFSLVIWSWRYDDYQPWTPNAIIFHFCFANKTRQTGSSVESRGEMQFLWLTPLLTPTNVSQICVIIVDTVGLLEEQILMNEIACRFS